MAVDVFISFSSADRELAERIYDRLQKFEVAPWMSSRDILPGMDYQGSIVDAIQQSKVVLLVFSSQANHSAEVVKELSLASTKLVIPARIEDVAPEGAFRYQISNRQFYDLFEDFDRRLDDLCKHVKATISGEGAVASPSTSATASRAKVRRARPKRSMLPWAIAGVFALVAAGAVAWLRYGPENPTPQQAAPITADGGSDPLAPPSTVVETPAGNVAPAASTEIPVDTTPDAPRPSEGPSAAAQTFAAMLAPGGYNRYSSVKELKAQIPPHLSADDAALILAGTESRHEETIRILVGNLAGDLDGATSTKILGNLSGYNRYSAIKTLANASKFKRELAAQDVVNILSGTESRRDESIKVLVPYISSNLDAASIASILEGMNGYTRYSGLRTLVDGGLVKHGLTQADIPTILGEIGSRRAEALKVLAPFMQ